MSIDIVTRHVQMSDVTVKYGRRSALDGVTLDLGVGVHGLLGPNGAGKTTLIRVLATVTRPSTGAVHLLGQNPERSSQARSARRGLGYLPQSFGFYPRFTVREFVEYFAWLKEVPGPQVALSTDRALTQVGLQDRANERMGRLSGGMLRRAGIAQAIVNQPAVLLLDEPTAGLDPEQRLDFRELVRAMGSDCCVLISTHLVEDVVAACDDVTLLFEGRVVFTGTADELTRQGEGRADAVGDSAVERGYTSVLQVARAGRLR